MTVMNKSVIIVAGGKGLRMGTEVPKQFLLLEGLPIIIHTILQFVKALGDLEVILVLPEDHVPYWESLVKEHGFEVPHKVVNGGPTRFHSAKNGLAQITGQGIVGIHDAVRPLVSKATIHRCYQNAAEQGNAIPAIAITDSLRIVEKGINKWVDRSMYRRIQTPQVFQNWLIQEAFRQDYSDSFTDDASVLETLGYDINLVDGNEENIKITQPADLILARATLKAKSL